MVKDVIDNAYPEVPEDSIDLKQKFQSKNGCLRQVPVIHLFH
jgi:hypothetical protein